MCGIVYSKLFHAGTVNNKVLKRYIAQRNRGIDGFGFYLPETNRLVHNTKEGRIKRLVKRYPASEILFHHRYPTSTDNVRSSCHPFSTKDNFTHNYVGVHNGVLSNDDDLKKAHYKLGYRYVSDDGTRYNDSEALLYDIALYLEGKQDKLNATGSIAFIVIQRNNGKPTNLYFGRNFGSPLVMQKNKHGITLSSEGSGELIDTDVLYRFNYRSKRIHTSELEIPQTKYVYNNAQYSFQQQTSLAAPRYDSYCGLESCMANYNPNGYCIDCVSRVSELDLNAYEILETASPELKDKIRWYLKVTKNDVRKALDLCTSHIIRNENIVDRMTSQYENKAPKHIEQKFDILDKTLALQYQTVDVLEAMANESI